MTLTLAATPVPLTTDADGVVRVAGTRVTLDAVVTAFLEGATAEEIVQQYPVLPLAEVYTVIGYYLHDQAGVDDYLRGRQHRGAEVRAENERRHPPEGLRSRLLARRRVSVQAVLRLMADENFNNDIVRGIVRRRPSTDLIRVQDAGLSGADDPAVLAWAAQAGRVLLTHDVTTMTRYAYERIQGRGPMPGLIEVGRTVSIGQAIEDLILLAECSREGEWEGQVLYLPLR